MNNEKATKLIIIPREEMTYIRKANDWSELYAKLKTWHLLVSQFRLTNDITIINRGLKLHKRNFPMFRRYKI